MTLEYRVGDVFDRLRDIPDGSIDLIVTSPPIQPFLALRSYLPADHPDKAREIGSEATPAAFLDTLLALSAEWGRVLAPHGSLCVELGDTYSGSGGGGGDYLPGGMREGQQQFAGSAATMRESNAAHWRQKNQPGANGRASMVDKAAGGHHMGGTGWPLAKSLTGIPTLYPWSLAYGRNLLTGQPSPAGQWRIRNLIVWARPNPPVGALGDKFRPATSYITVACRGAKRYFDLDAVRSEPGPVGGSATPGLRKVTGARNDDGGEHITNNHPAGAPPLDWHTDQHPEDGDWLWKMATQPYAGAHYATFPMALPKRLIEAMCPLRVCAVCGLPSERIVDVDGLRGRDILAIAGDNDRGTGLHGARPSMPEITRTTTGWTDCGCAVTPSCHNERAELGSSCRQGVSSTASDGSTPGSASHWRTGVVLDPFAGSGTTLEAAQAVGRHAIGIDLDSRNADLARSRVGMFLDIDGAVA